MRVARRSGPGARNLDGPRLAAGVLAIVVGVSAIWVVAVIMGFEPGALLESPELPVGGFIVVGVLGWAAAPAALARGWARTILVGAGTGFATGIALFAYLMVAALTDVALREGPALGSAVGPALAWGLYGLVLSIMYFAIFTIPVGVLWAATIRLSLRNLAISTGSRGAPRHAGTTAVLAILLIGASTGGAQTLRTWQPDAMCPALDGAPVIDASFSPDGSAVAVITSRDPNAEGTVWLIERDSGRTITTWTTWVDQDVVTDGNGRVWWTAFEAQGPYRSAIMTATVGEAPTWFSDPDAEVLWGMQWTDDAIVGMTANSHTPASIDLRAEGPPRLVADEQHDAIGSIWVSADRETMVTSPEWGSEALTVASSDPSMPKEIAYRGDPRSMSMTPDGAGLVIADWRGKTRLVDIRTGQTRVLLDRSQRFAVVSSRGDLAWADDESIGTSRLCIAHRFDG